MRALITGVTGFVGTHLAAWLLTQGDEVLGVSRSAQWHFGLDEYPRLRSIELLPWDITQAIPAATEQRIRQFAPDVVFHLAALSIPADCGASDPTPEAYATNVQGTGRVLELTTTLALPPAFMLASSCHVYGTPTGATDEFDESAKLQPENGYGHTKMSAEQLTTEAIESTDLNAWIVRGFQQTGPLQPDRMLLPEWARQFAARNTQIRVRTLGTTLDLMDIRDSVRVYYELAKLAIESNKLQGAIINVGTGIRRSGSEIIEHFSDVAGYHPEILESSPGQRRNPIASIDRLLVTLKWAPDYSFRDTVKDTYEYWQRQNG